ncbi:UDP-glycosyltransferase 83A1 [Manihot esculenta]|uniref:Uncharacterized protein n=1 Tax=Manihot esculenta TaxID=3983 RepID=A0ACB7I3G7_MANES|nr:UDP-glycosyltransferase 83A1 [Manihot esculenta]KAG8659614.1 hypothetical protein MANES_02G054300v8 [Manihot esculenta]
MRSPRILVVPYPVQGHVIPLMELSKCLAKHGLRITFVNTEYNHQLIKNASEGNNIGDDIHVVSVSDGIHFSEDKNKPGKSSEAILRVMPGKVEELIEEINASGSDKIGCILADQSFGWALEIAEKKGIRRAAFCPAAAAQLVLGFSIPKLIEDGIIDDHGTPTKQQIIQISPTMPAVNTANFVWACLGNKEAQKNIFGLMVRNNKSVKLTDWLLCNSTYDLEPGAFNLAPQLLPIGPLLASNRQADSVGNFWPEDTTCLAWLDQQPPESVIYVAFGSLAVLHQTQFQELALGLELCNRPFLWVIRSDIRKGTTDAFLKEFQDRVGTRGKVVDWAPQQKVLAHPSVACFVSHCGWNSTIEGVSNGILFLCWPCFADQFLNQSYICDIWKIGLGFERDENGRIMRGEFKNKVEQLLSNGEFKARALELKEMVINSAKETGSSYQNFKKFVEWLKE